MHPTIAINYASTNQSMVWIKIAIAVTIVVDLENHYIGSLHPICLGYTNSNPMAFWTCAMIIYVSPHVSNAYKSRLSPLLRVETMVPTR